MSKFAWRVRSRLSGFARQIEVWRLAGACLAWGALLLGSSAAIAGNVVEYVYDVAGNITQIVRQSVGGLAITGVDPGSGSVGATVTIVGFGFSPTPAGNTVRFNGVAATVAAANSGSISATVPAGATTGRITVTVGGATATSAQDFVVVVPGAPTIAAFGPASGAAGTLVTVAGTNFDAVAGATTVRLNGVAAAATVTDATALTFTVPAAAASGRITATTALGTGTSATDFLVPPAGVSAADIATVVRVAPDGPPGSLVVSTAHKHGVLLFDGAGGAFHTLQFSLFATSPTSAAISYQVVSPDSSVLATGTVGNASRPTIHIPRLPATGTYSVFVSVGTATLNTNVRLVTDPLIPVDGAAAASALDYAGQSARFVFETADAQRIGVGVLGVSVNPAGAGNVSFNAYRPDGTALYAPAVPSCGGATSLNPQGNCDGEFTTVTAGTHTLVATSPPTAVGNFTVQLSTEATGSLVTDVPQDAALARVGQDARYTFAANAGDSLAIGLSAINPQPVAQNFATTVYKPDGAALGACNGTPPAGVNCELGSVPATGTYSVWVDPAFGALGSFRLALKQGPMLAAADPPTSFAAASDAESARFRIAATAGQNLAVGVAGLAYVGSSSSATYLSVYRPDRTQVGSAVSCSPTVGGGTCKATLSNLPLTGTYAVVLVPPGGVKLTGTINVSPDLEGSLAPGAPVTLGATRAGRDAPHIGDSLQRRARHTELRLIARDGDLHRSSRALLRCHVGRAAPARPRHRPFGGRCDAHPRRRIGWRAPPVPVRRKRGPAPKHRFVGVCLCSPERQRYRLDAVPARWHEPRVRLLLYLRQRLVRVELRGPSGFRHLFHGGRAASRERNRRWDAGPVDAACGCLHRRRSPPGRGDHPSRPDSAIHLFGERGAATPSCLDQSGDKRRSGRRRERSEARRDDARFRVDRERSGRRTRHRLASDDRNLHHRLRPRLGRDDVRDHLTRDSLRT